MTDEPTTTAPAAATEPAPDPAPAAEPGPPAADPAAADADPVDAFVDDYRTRRLKYPRVSLSVALPMDDEAWTARGVAHVSRPDVEVEARRMPTAFVFELPDYRSMEGVAGDWLIRERTTGHVFALTDRAFRMLYEPLTEEVPEAPSA